MSDDHIREENQEPRAEMTLAPSPEAPKQPTGVVVMEVNPGATAPADVTAPIVHSADPASTAHASGQALETGQTVNPLENSDPSSEDLERHTLPYSAPLVPQGAQRRSSLPPSRSISGFYKQPTLREKFKSKSFAEEWQEAMGSADPKEEPVLDLSDEMVLEPEDEKEVAAAAPKAKPVFGGVLAQPAAVFDIAAEVSVSSIIRVGAERIPVFEDEPIEELTEADVHANETANEISVVEDEPVEELTEADMDEQDAAQAISLVDDMNIEEMAESDMTAAGEAVEAVRDILGVDPVPARMTSREAAAEEAEAKKADPEEAALDEASAQDDEEEIDLAEAEEVSTSIPPPTPITIMDGTAVAPSVPPPAPTDGDSRRPRIRRRGKSAQEWWARIFNDDYVSTIPKATVRGDQRKVNFIEKHLAVPVNALVLDLACGNGRHSVGMAKRGYRVVGIDLSLPMLAQAAELAQDERQNINFIHGDMRDLNFDRTFDGIFCMGTSFGYFDDQTNYKVLQGVARSLKPGGSFLIEVANRDHVIMKLPDLTWFEGNGSICMEESSFDFVSSRIIVMRQLIMDGGRQVQNDISIRLYSLHELGEMLTRSGFTVTNISGHQATPGAFFGPDSVRILIACKRNL